MYKRGPYRVTVWVRGGDGLWRTQEVIDAGVRDRGIGLALVPRAWPKSWHKVVDGWMAVMRYW